VNWDYISSFPYRHLLSHLYRLYHLYRLRPPHNANAIYIIITDFILTVGITDGMDTLIGNGAINDRSERPMPTICLLNSTCDLFRWKETGLDSRDRFFSYYCSYFVGVAIVTKPLNKKCH
jgi:hypothetical protein